MRTKRLCACDGQNLDRLLQPTVMGLLASGPRHGYALVAELSESPLMGGAKPNDTGVYRLLAVLEEQDLVTHQVEESDEGRSKRVYELTPLGWTCLDKWIITLDAYGKAVGQVTEFLRERGRRED